MKTRIRSILFLITLAMCLALTTPAQAALIDVVIDPDPLNYISGFSIDGGVTVFVDLDHTYNMTFAEQDTWASTYGFTWATNSMVNDVLTLIVADNSYTVTESDIIGGGRHPYWIYGTQYLYANGRTGENTLHGGAGWHDGTEFTGGPSSGGGTGIGYSYNLNYYDDGQANDNFGAWLTSGGASLVPAPPAILLLGSGLVGLAGLMRKFRKS